MVGATKRTTNVPDLLPIRRNIFSQYLAFLHELVVGDVWAGGDAELRTRSFECLVSDGGRVGMLYCAYGAKLEWQGYFRW